MRDRIERNLTFEMKVWKWTLITVFVVLFLVGLIVAFTAEPIKSRKERLESFFNPIDGTYGPLLDRTKADLFDPESLEPVRTRYIDSGSNEITVEMTYRSKNAYGFVIPGRSVCTMDSTGILIKYNSAQ